MELINSKHKDADYYRRKFTQLFLNKACRSEYNFHFILFIWNTANLMHYLRTTILYIYTQIFTLILQTYLIPMYLIRLAGKSIDLRTTVFDTYIRNNLLKEKLVRCADPKTFFRIIRTF